MDANTTRTRLRRLEQRLRLQSALDGATYVESHDRTTCAEPGCDERVWIGRRFCIWHPKLRTSRRSA